MSYDVTTVVGTPAASRDMTTLAVVKDEIGVTDTATDSRLTRWITETSAFIESYLNRAIPSEAVTDTFRFRPADGRLRLSDFPPLATPVLLQRYPVSTITSVTEDSNTALDASLYDLDAPSGRLWRLDANGNRVMWRFGIKLVVVYAGGYAMLSGLPQAIQHACQKLIVRRWYEYGMDPALMREQVEGVGLNQWQRTNPGDPGMPADIADLLDPYRRVNQ